MRVVTTIVGGFWGVIPGLLLFAFGQLITGGGDGMLLFGFFGVLLVAIGAVAGLVGGWKAYPRIGGRLGWVIAAGLLGVVVFVVLMPVVVEGPGNVFRAGTCIEVYEELGSSGPGDENFVLPPPGSEELRHVRGVLSDSESASDPACDALRDELETQDG